MKNKFLNIDKYINETNTIYKYIYDKKFKYEYNYEIKKFRNNYLLNTNHSRYYKNNLKYDFDPLIFENEVKIWPDVVTNIYYTNITPNNKIVQLSYTSNVYINLCLKNQDYAPLSRIYFYAIYDILSLKEKNYKLTKEDIFKKFINKDIVQNYENVDFYYNNYIINNFNLKKTKLIQTTRNNIITNWAYKNFYDYIPICYVLNNYNPNNMVMSDVCFHNSYCHDSLCKTHNFKFSINSHIHTDNQYLYNFHPIQIVPINKLY